MHNQIKQTQNTEIETFLTQIDNIQNNQNLYVIQEQESENLYDLSPSKRSFLLTPKYPLGNITNSEDYKQAFQKNLNGNQFQGQKASTPNFAQLPKPSQFTSKIQQQKITSDQKQQQDKNHYQEGEQSENIVKNIYHNSSTFQYFQQNQNQIVNLEEQILQLIDENQKLISYCEELKPCKEKNAAQSKEIQSLKEKIAAMNFEIDTMALKSIQSQNENGRLLITNEKLQSDINKERENLELLRKDVQSIKTDKQRFVNLQDNNNGEIEHMTKQKYEVQEQLKYQIEEIHRLNNLNEQLQIQQMQYISQDSKDKTLLENESIELFQKNTILEKNIKRLEQKLSLMNSESDKMCKNFEQSADEMKQQMMKIEDQYRQEMKDLRAKFKNEKDELEQQAIDLINENKNLMEYCQKFSKEQEIMELQKSEQYNYQELFHQKQEELQILHNRYENYQSENFKLKEDKERILNELLQERESLEVIREDLDAFKQESLQQLNTQGQYQQQITQLQLQVRALENQEAAKEIKFKKNIREIKDESQKLFKQLQVKSSEDIEELRESQEKQLKELKENHSKQMQEQKEHYEILLEDLEQKLSEALQKQSEKQKQQSDSESTKNNQSDQDKLQSQEEHDSSSNNELSDKRSQKNSKEQQQDIEEMIVGEEASDKKKNEQNKKSTNTLKMKNTPALQSKANHVSPLNKHSPQNLEQKRNLEYKLIQQAEAETEQNSGNNQCCKTLRSKLELHKQYLQTQEQTIGFLQEKNEKERQININLTNLLKQSGEIKENSDQQSRQKDKSDRYFKKQNQNEQYNYNNKNSDTEQNLHYNKPRGNYNSHNYSKSSNNYLDVLNPIVPYYNTKSKRNQYQPDYDNHQKYQDEISDYYQPGFNKNRFKQNNYF